MRYRPHVGCQIVEMAQGRGRLAGSYRRIPACRSCSPPTCQRIVDGSVIRSKSKGSTDWRLHATYDPAEGRFSQLEITDTHGGESLSRRSFEKGDLVLGDRGYARTPGLLHVLESGAHFVMRIGWSAIRRLTPNGARLDWNAIYAGMQPGDIAEHDVLADHSGRKEALDSTSTFRTRLIVRRKEEASAERARKAIYYDHRRKQRLAAPPDPLKVRSADFMPLPTSISACEMSAAEVAAPYRMRWQIELAFKRLKSGLGINALRARDNQLARSWLAAHLILGLLIDEAAADSLASPLHRWQGREPIGHYGVRKHSCETCSRSQSEGKAWQTPAEICSNRHDEGFHSSAE